MNGAKLHVYMSCIKINKTPPEIKINFYYSKVLLLLLDRWSI